MNQKPLLAQGPVDVTVRQQESAFELGTAHVGVESFHPILTEPSGMLDGIDNARQNIL